MHSKFDLYLLSLHASVAISILELVQFPNNEKSLQKKKPHTLLDSWAINTSYLRQVATLGLVDNRGCPCAHDVLQPMAFFTRSVSNLYPQLQSFSAISAIYSPLYQDLRAMRDYRKKPQKHFEVIVMLVQEKLKLTKQECMWPYP
jgi:hypothetical protein